VLLQASLFGEFDDVNGVTENIMLGQIAKAGTGIVELILDETKLANAVEVIPMDRDDGEGGWGRRRIIVVVV